MCVHTPKFYQNVFIVTSLEQETGTCVQEEPEPEEPETEEPETEEQAPMEPRRPRSRRPGRRRPNAVELPWQRVHSDTDTSPPSLVFSQSVGPTTVLPDDSTPFDCFSQIITQSIVESLVEETNK